MAKKPTITMAERHKMIMDLRARFTETFIVDLKKEHPDWSDAKIRGVAENMAQKHVSQNTQWNVDVVGKTQPNRTFEKIGVVIPGKDKVVYKAGRGEETMVEKELTASQKVDSATNNVKDFFSNLLKKKK
ncbi:MAG: hypothetical protein ABFD15_03795 [Methanofastidiosum sp.]